MFNVVRDVKKVLELEESGMWQMKCISIKCIKFSMNIGFGWHTKQSPIKGIYFKQLPAESIDQATTDFQHGKHLVRILLYKKQK